MPRQYFDLKLTANKHIAPSVLHLEFTRVDGQPLDFIPGQFINFHIDDAEKSHSRSFSIANAPGSNTLEIAISYVQSGLASEMFFNMPTGTVLKASGPYGRLVLKDNDQPKRFILVATGTGVTPYRAMLNDIDKRLSADPELTVELIQGVREPAELIYKDDFLNFSKQSPRFNYTACYSRVQPEDPQSFEYAGRLIGVLQQMECNLDNDIVFLCGNPNMIDDAFELLTQAGLASAQIRREKYVFSKT